MDFAQKAIRKTTAIPTNLSIVKNKIAQKEDTQKRSAAVIEPKELKLEEFTDNDLTTAWESFIDHRKKSGGEQEVAFLKHTYVRNKDIIRIQIHNSILELTFDKLKVDLQTHLRLILKNDCIKVELEKLESDSKKMIYTNKEKFEHLASLHPAVKLLQEKLSLDPDY